MRQKIITWLVCISLFLVQVSYANTCGNNIIETWEECDDGNMQQSDGCNVSCMNEFCGDAIVTNGTWISNQAVVSWASSETLCTDIQVSLFLEWAFDSWSTTMYTTLNDQLLLPWQSWWTPPWHPYTINPWYYTWNEWQSYNFALIGDNKANYPENIVDWVLISIRDNDLPNSTTCQLAGLLQNDWHIIFPTDGDRCCYLEEGQDYYIVAEHRNHLVAMSASQELVVNNTIRYDFRSQQSYEDDPFWFWAYAKQTELSPWVYGLFGGNSSQTNDISSANDTDINWEDQRIITNDLWAAWYRSTDVNLDGIVSDIDNNIQNSAMFTSVVIGNPKSPSSNNQKTRLYEHTLYEEVDDGNANNFDTAPNDCKLAVCGDWVIEWWEECELIDPSGCNEKESCTDSCLCISLSHWSISSITPQSQIENSIQQWVESTWAETTTLNETIIDEIIIDEITKEWNTNTIDTIELRKNILWEIAILKKHLEDKTKKWVHYFIWTPRYLKTWRTIEQWIKALSIDTKISKNVIVESPTWGKPHYWNYPKNLEYWIDTVLKPYDPAWVDSSMFLLIPKAGYLVPIQQVTKNSEPYNKLITWEEIDIEKDLQMLFAKWALHHAWSVEPGQYWRAVLAMHTSWFTEWAGKYPTIGQLLLTLEPWDYVHIFKKKWNDSTYERFDYVAQETKVINENETEYLYPEYWKELLLYWCAPIGTSKDRMITILRTNDNIWDTWNIHLRDRLKIDNAFKKISQWRIHEVEWFMINLRTELSQKQIKKLVPTYYDEIINYIRHKIASSNFFN